MRSTAVISGMPAGPADGAEWARTLAVRARRMKQRRRMFDLIAASYLIDATLLLLYSFAGTIPQIVVPAYIACGFGISLASIALSEFGFHDRFKDHYLVIPTAAVNLALVMGFCFWAPQVAFLFLCSLFIIFSFASLRATPQQSLICWAAMTAVLAVLFVFTTTPIAMPNGTLLERLVTMLVLVLTIGRCVFIGMYSSAMRESLYKRGQQLREAYQRIEELAELDELTGAFNRRCIMRMLDDEIARADRSATPLSLALIDLDWFKRINDSFGHPTGDEVLRTFAITIFANIRSFDRFGRYGGEEFLLLLPNTTPGEAHVILDRLREIVSDLDWTAFSPGMRVTLSAGLTTMSPEETAESVLARADAALYAAKEKGRNRIAMT
ncbi:MAG: GGDEF domain-containing protein [Rhodopseudomonas palustris]|uniref:diguanylate cyclase n=1 Tax=Rhodopseudomonas palustris TaxID=1076 RepID=A0A933RYF0_RHOPL|nr:GGDEF domain-containing protein [Rhodopseudomonas palustris]